MKKYLCILLAVLLMAASLTACATNTADASTETDSGTESETEAAKVTYAISIKSMGGSSFGRLNYLVYRGEVAIAHGATDQNGLSSVELPEGGDYSVEIISPLPEGYQMQSRYPLTGTETFIRIPSSVMEDTSLEGVSYRLGQVMHDFTVTTVDGETLTLSRVLEEKKAVMLNFWYTGCGPCRSEFPHMQAAYAAQEGVEIIAMDDVGETTDKIRAFKDEYGLTFPVVNEELGIGKAFHLTGYPTSVFIDRYGVICFIHVGGLSEAQFANAFAYFSADDYNQTLFDHIDEIPQMD